MFLANVFLQHLVMCLFVGFGKDLTAFLVISFIYFLEGIGTANFLVDKNLLS